MKAKEAVLAGMLAATMAIVPLAGCSAQSGNANNSSSEASVSAVEQAGDAQYVLYLGTNDKDTNQPVFTREEAKEHAKAILMKDFGGYTIQEAEGGWRDDDGTEYQEYTLVIYLSDTDIDMVHAAAKELIAEFNQSSILISTDKVETEFYEGQ